MTRKGAKIEIEVTGETGVSSNAALDVDNVMLERTEGCSSYNLVQLGNFEQYSINSSNTYISYLNTYWSAD